MNSDAIVGRGKGGDTSSYGLFELLFGPTFGFPKHPMH